jgi:transcriptional regulator with XRE-family HTH domain
MRAAKEWLRRVREQRGLSQRDLAARLRISQTAVSRYESGETGVLSDEKLADLCRELGLDPDDIPPDTATVFCENPNCIRNSLFTNGHTLAARPQMQVVPAEGEFCCESCGWLLARCCPNEDCRASPRDGAAFCHNCGTPLVDMKKRTPTPDKLLAEAREHNARRAEFLEQFRPGTSTVSPPRHNGPVDLEAEVTRPEELNT